MLKKWTIGLLSVLLIVSNFNVPMISASESDVTDSDWKLVWSDEFDEDEINMDNWSFDHPENGRYNQEIQSYTEDNAWIEDGKLFIEAREEEITEPNGETYNYTSSKLITKGKQMWTYGKFEIRAKMPTGQGMWPAIWMMPEDEPFYGTWPVGGEIDIMELLGHEPDTIYANIHYGVPKGDSQGTYKLPNGQSFAEDYHVYTLEWEPGEIRWYIDGELFNTANDWHSKHPGNADEFTYPAPFDQDFFLILNISVGGGWPGNPDDTTVFPQQMAVDYVRVYQKDEYPVREKPEPEEEDSEGRAPLEDGNYIYNGSFNSGTDHWTFLQGPGGDAKIEVENGEFHAAITAGGTVDYGVQLIQDTVPLERGARYKASFRAKAEEERDIKVKLGGGASRGYSEYSLIPPVRLSEKWGDYEFEFVMPERTDLNSRFEFNMGLNDADVWLSDVRLDKIEDASTTEPSFEPRSPLPGGNYIYNGTFDQGIGRMAFWEFKADDSSDVNYYIGSAVDERRFDALINNGGAHAESIQLVQPQVNLEEGNSYQLTFDASADVSRDIRVSLVSSNGNVIADQAVGLDPEMKEYSFKFNVDVVTDNDVELQFNIGGSDDNVYLDNVELTRVLASDGIEDNLIRNGIFDSLSHWSTEFNHSKAEFKVDEDGHFKVNITDVGYATWAIQLYQKGVNIEKDATYQLSFEARSTIDRPVLLNVENSTDYTKYLEETVSLTDSWETYNYEFTMNEETDPDTKFGFSFGGDGSDNIPSDEHDIFIDNVVLRKVEETDEEPGEDDDQATDPSDKDDEEQMQELLDRISNLEDRIKDLEDSSHLEDFENRINNLEQELLALKTQYNNLEDRNSEIEQQIVALQEEIARFKALLSDQDDVVNGTDEDDQSTKADGDKATAPAGDDQNLESDNKLPTTEDGDDQVTVPAGDDQNPESGNKLPKTATATFNWLVIGSSVLLVGMALAFFTRRKLSVLKKDQ
ncbi:carbohydrate binding domain-containing protein [Amphibacillus indicireducens]|uniref:GH16 domain-containing protein n=1 Tax=Amphibacillus indicireducens TaxID=1076330 RepID=A0ABP7W5N8_9BACI